MILLNTITNCVNYMISLYPHPHSPRWYTITAFDVINCVLATDSQCFPPPWCSVLGVGGEDHYTFIPHVHIFWEHEEILHSNTILDYISALLHELTVYQGSDDSQPYNVYMVYFNIAYLQTMNNFLHFVTPEV